MHPPMPLFFVMPLALALAVAAPPAWAQGKAPVLQGKQVTESALIGALALPGPAGPATGATRGFGVVRPSVAGRALKATPAKAAPGKASLVMTFETDSAELTADALQTLDTVAKALQSDQLAGFAFSIEGHADPRGDEIYNRDLSQRRAAAVVENLVQRHGILPERLKPVGKGSSELQDRRNPAADVNRRVTIVTERG